MVELEVVERARGLEAAAQLGDLYQESLHEVDIAPNQEVQLSADTKVVSYIYKPSVNFRFLYKVKRHLCNFKYVHGLECMYL